MQALAKRINLREVLFISGLTLATPLTLYWYYVESFSLPVFHFSTFSWNWYWSLGREWQVLIGSGKLIWYISVILFFVIRSFLKRRTAVKKIV